MTEDKAVLSDEEIRKELETLPGWRRAGILIEKTYVFENFKQINAFLPHVAGTIVRLNHHPDLVFLPGKKSFEFTTTTHSHKAITRADIALARALESWTPPA